MVRKHQEIDILIAEKIMEPNHFARNLYSDFYKWMTKNLSELITKNLELYFCSGRTKCPIWSKYESKTYIDSL